jgi:hypothetical protein
VASFGRCFRGRWAQRVGAHHDALAVDLQHEQVVRHTWRGQAGRVEGLEVHRCRRGQALHLALAHLLAGRSLDGLHRLVETTAGTFHRGQLAQPVGLLLLWQVEPGVGRIQVRAATLAVGDPADLGLAEHGGQRAGVADLNRPVRHRMGV